MGQEIFVSVDIEAAGHFPRYSMLSLGACLVKDTSKTFYREFKPVNDLFEPEAIEICGLSMEKLKMTGVEPRKGMLDFKYWLSQECGQARPVFTALNAPFDWMFVDTYFRTYLGDNPFGHNALDIKAYYMGKFGTSWEGTLRRNMDPNFLTERRHTHNALDDAIEQAEIFRKIIESAKV